MKRLLALVLLLPAIAWATINAASFQRSLIPCSNDSSRWAKYPAGLASCTEDPPDPPATAIYLFEGAQIGNDASNTDIEIDPDYRSDESPTNAALTTDLSLETDPADGGNQVLQVDQSGEFADANYEGGTARWRAFVAFEQDDTDLRHAPSASGESHWTGYRFRVPSTADCGSNKLTITAITRANPGVVTYTGTDPVNGATYTMWGLGGMVELYGKVKVANVNTSANTFQLQTTASVNLNTTSYTAFTSGGRAYLDAQPCDQRVYTWNPVGPTIGDPTLYLEGLDTLRQSCQRYRDDSNTLIEENFVNWTGIKADTWHDIVIQWKYVPYLRSGGPGPQTGYMKVWVDDVLRIDCYSAYGGQYTGTDHVTIDSTTPKIRMGEYFADDRPGARYIFMYDDIRIWTGDDDIGYGVVAPR